MFNDFNEIKGHHVTVSAALLSDFLKAAPEFEELRANTLKNLEWCELHVYPLWSVSLLDE